jgi:hypothetical protein
MTTFKEIRGTAVESVSSDPTNPEVGQIWYNNSIGVLKGYQLSAAAWSAVVNLSTAQDVSLGRCWNSNRRIRIYWSNINI